jgi:glycosyltransferase involved in cell wall biosynthesis
MTEDDYPRDLTTRRVYRWIERQAIEHGALFLFTATSTIEMYLQRYPGLQREKCILLPNGYDEQDFRTLPAPPAQQGSNQRPLRLLHSGLIYREERDPRPLFQALAKLKTEGQIDASSLQIDLRASGEEAYFAGLIQEMGIEDLVHLLPALPYHESLRDSTSADGLLLFQGITCNHQIPAKAYEYFRLRKPVLALTRHEGDTAALLQAVGGATIVDMYDPEAISLTLLGFLQDLRQSTHPLADPDKTRRYERRSQAFELADRLRHLIGEDDAVRGE